MSKIKQLEVLEVYRNTANWKDLEDEFNKMFHSFSDGIGIKNMGGIRIRKTRKGKIAFIILVTNFSEPEWPDELNIEHAAFTYYGDNRTHNNDDFHNTNAGGNLHLRNLFLAAASDRKNVAPVLCFQSFEAKSYSYMRFLGLCVPGISPNPLDDLCAMWRAGGETPFLNYRAVFAILDVPAISWKWLSDITEGVNTIDAADCPEAWSDWVNDKKILRLNFRDYLLFKTP